MIFNRTIKFGEHEVYMALGDATAVCSCGGIVEYIAEADFISTAIRLNHLTKPL